MGHAKNAYTDMVRRISLKTGIKQFQVREVMVTFIQETLTDLAQGKSVHLMSLGKFWVKKAEPRYHWNPKIKKKTFFQERYFPRFEFGGKAHAFIKEEAKRNCAGTADRRDSTELPAGESEQVQGNT